MKVLVVEDSEIVRDLQAEMLHELGHETVAVATAEDALSRLASESFTVVMTDVSLPGMSGIDLAKAVRDSIPTLPIIVATGHGEFTEQVLRQQLRHQVFALRKPFDFASLEEVLTRAAAGSR